MSTEKKPPRQTPQPQRLTASASAWLNVRTVTDRREQERLQRAARRPLFLRRPLR